MIEASLILCDFAEQDPAGKVHMLGAGWSLIGPGPQPHAVVFFIRTSPQKGPVDITLRLLYADNQVVTMPGIAGQQRLEFPGQITLRSIPGSPVDAEGQGAFAVNVGALPLSPGSKYSWVLEIEGKEEARTSFYVRESLSDPPAAPS